MLIICEKKHNLFINFLKGLLIICTVFLIACASHQSGEDKMTPEQLADKEGYDIVESVKRIPNYRIDGWNYVSPGALRISAGVRDTYLIVLRHACYGLRSADVIGTTATGNSLTNFESIILRDDATGKEVCPISHIYKLKKKES